MTFCSPAPDLEAFIFTLPAGYRPAAQDALPALSSEAPTSLARLDVTATGQVVLRRPDIPQDGWLSLDGITFRAA